MVNLNHVVNIERVRNNDRIQRRSRRKRINVLHNPNLRRRVDLMLSDAAFKLSLGMSRSDFEFFEKVSILKIR